MRASEYMVLGSTLLMKGKGPGPGDGETTGCIWQLAMKAAGRSGTDFKWAEDRWGAHFVVKVFERWDAEYKNGKVPNIDVFASWVHSIEPPEVVGCENVQVEQHATSDSQHPVAAGVAVP
jgi:hypothetical protein